MTKALVFKKNKRGVVEAGILQIMGIILGIALVVSISIFFGDFLGIFTGGAEEQTNLVNFNSLAFNVQQMIDAPVPFASAEIPFYLVPDWGILVGFDKGWKGDAVKASACNNEAIEKPVKCQDKACLCVFKDTNSDDFENDENPDKVIDCKVFEGDVVFLGPYDDEGLVGQFVSGYNVGSLKSPVPSDYCPDAKYEFLVVYGNCGKGYPDFSTGARKFYIEKFVDSKTTYIFISDSGAMAYFDKKNQNIANRAGILSEKIIDALFQKANQAFDFANYEDAIRYYTQVINMGKQASKSQVKGALFSLAQAYEKNNQTDLAIQVYEEFAKEYSLAELNIALGIDIIYYALPLPELQAAGYEAISPEEAEKAIRKYKLFAKSLPKNLYFRHLLGKLYFLQEDYENSIKELDYVLENYRPFDVPKISVLYDFAMASKDAFFWAGPQEKTAYAEQTAFALLSIINSYSQEKEFIDIYNSAQNLLIDECSRYERELIVAPSSCEGYSLGIDENVNIFSAFDQLECYSPEKPLLRCGEPSVGDVKEFRQEGARGIAIGSWTFNNRRIYKCTPEENIWKIYQLCSEDQVCQNQISGSGNYYRSIAATCITPKQTSAQEQTKTNI